MKKLIFIFIIGMITQISSVNAQLQPGECGIMFTYDATGSITKREFICNNTGVVMNRNAKAENTKVDFLKSGNKNEIAEEEILKVNAIMPNPTTGMFTVTLSKPVKNANILLLNNTGSVIERKKITGIVVSFDISNRASGTYYVRIENEKLTSVTFKVIKQ